MTTLKLSMKILIADDEPNMRTTLSDILQDEGYEVATAADGNEAVDLCSHNDYDLILLDARMPGLDGVETFRRIRRHREGVRVILMSAYSVDDLKISALQDGAIAFLDKPLHVADLIKLIAETKETAILVVEDDNGTAARLGDALKGEKYHVSMTKSPHEALELVEQIRFDIVFIDAKLPSMNGLELYLAIKKISPTSVAIMVTGGEQEFEEIAREAVRQTAYTIIKKPLDLDHVLGLLKRLTGQRASNTILKPDDGD